jgi:hypothetical protein
MGRPSENDPIDLDPARDRAMIDEKISKAGPEVSPSSFQPAEETTGELEKTPKVQTEAEAGIPPGTLEQSEQARSEHDVEREVPESGEPSREGVEGGQPDKEVEREIESDKPKAA